MDRGGLPGRCGIADFAQLRPVPAPDEAGGKSCKCSQAAYDREGPPSSILDRDRHEERYRNRSPSADEAANIRIYLFWLLFL